MSMEPAFPTKSTVVDREGTAHECDITGMTLRDYFAAAALTGQAMHYGLSQASFDMAERAYEAADAMLAERAK